MNCMTFVIKTGKTKGLFFILKRGRGEFALRGHGGRNFEEFSKFSLGIRNLSEDAVLQLKL